GRRTKMRRAQGPKCALPILSSENKKEDEDKISSSSAAADLFAPLQKQEARTALSGLDFPRGLIDRYIAMHGADFALLAATHFSERFRDKQKRPIESKIGYMRNCFHDPTSCGFEFMNGRWQLPPADSTAREREQQRAEQQARD